MNLANPTQTVLYSIEQAIKEYRKFSQKNIKQVIGDITVDQCLVLIILDKKSASTQMEIARLIYKDYASVTRMIELMVKKKYLIRKVNPADRRKFDLEISAKGKNALELLTPKIMENRQTALQGLSDEEIDQLENLLQKIITNCKTA